MNYALPIALLVFSLGFLVVEVFVPSLGVLTLASLGCLVAALVLGFDVGSGFGWSLVATALVGVPVILVLSFKVFPKTPLGRHMILFGPRRHPEPATRNHSAELVGREGIARSPLRPSGTADFDGDRLDVITRGELVEPGTRIRIIETRGNRIVVRSVEEPAGEEEEELR